MEHLDHDLPHCQVSPESHLAGGAERASYRAPNLRGNTGGPPSFIVHQDGFDGLTVLQLKKVFTRLAITGFGGFHDGWTADHGFRLQPLAQGLGQVEHLVEAGSMVGVQPVPELTCSVRTLAPTLDERFKPRKVELV